MGSSCSNTNATTTTTAEVVVTTNDSIANTFNDNNSCLLAVQFENVKSIRVLKYHSAIDEWTIIHEIPVKGLYRTAIVKQYLLFHDWQDGVRVCCYDTTTRAIRTLKPLKADQPYWSCYCAAEYQERLYLIGAETHDNRKVYAWDPEKDVLTEAPKLIIGRTRTTALKHDDYLYVAGGMNSNDGNERDTNSVERYNPRRNCWERCAPMLQARAVAGLASAGRFIFAVGGDCAATPTNMVERYDTHTNKWTQLTAMQIPKVFPGTIFFNNRLMVCGNSSNQEDCSLVEELDESTKKWIRKNKMPIDGSFSYIVATPAWVRQLESLN
ncbi:PREDICTED: kelch-like protein 12 [Bactrocera latifrons]|uniref:Kelch-like protein 1 n=1 Tax=Bactrocera latifrons TaxID=174628 RepID=A0A0K8WCI2_BACLA|nr:PREDICTED: kelch-like protein 12 [Bactrocera latifrons]